MSEAKKDISKLNFVKMNDEKEQKFIETDLVENQGREVSKLSHKKFSDYDDEADVKTERLQLPSFLKNVGNKDNSSEKANNLGSGLNSLGSIFASDRDEVSGVQRVFRKSVIFTVIHLIFFFILTFVGLNWFNTNILINIFWFVSYITITNIFYIVVADRSYVWLSLLGQAFLVILANSFYGFGFNYVTLLSAFIIILFSYLAYSELEKVQLSSRLFSVSHITTESSRILLTSAIVLVSLGVFNGVLFQGSNVFLKKVFFDNSFLMENAVIGKSQNLSMNRYLMEGKFFLEGNKIVFGAKTTAPDKTTSTINKQATFGNFLENNYKTSSVFSDKELKDLKSEKCLPPLTPEAKGCTDLVQKEINLKLEEYRVASYGNLPYTLDTQLNKTNFAEISTQFYSNSISDFEAEKKGEDNGFIDQSLLIIPLKNIIPVLVALTIFVILTAFRFLFSWFIFMLTWVIWKIMALTGFVHIDIETVEAEIVSI